MHALSAKSYRLDDSRGQRLKRACDKSIIDKNEHVFVYMVRYMPAGAISFDIVLAGIFLLSHAVGADFEFREGDCNAIRI